MIDQLDFLIGEIEQGWSNKRVLVIGDVMLDKYIWGNVERISPEAPVPVVHASHETQQPGGAANVAMNLAHLGAQAEVIGFTGADDYQDALTRCLHENSIATAFVACDGFPTITKLRILGARQQMLRLDFERISARSSGEYERLKETVRSRLDGCHAVILSDYAKGVLTPDVCQAVIQPARAAGIPVLVDPKSADFDRYRGATTICPNLNELSKAVQQDARDIDKLLDAAEAMVAQFGLDFLTATMSEKGIALLRPGRRVIAPAEARQVFDVSGAGDTVIAVLALCLSSGIAPENAIQVANLAAGVVVGKVGTVPVERHELLAALNQEISLHAQEKIVTQEELQRRTAAWRRNGERVVFTNGCFDLLHVGHITVLEQSRHFGDRLVIAINSDASVKLLKGDSRPIVGQNERARVLAALGAVDAVVIFDESTPLELKRAVRPDVIVKGGDYTPDTVLGAKEVMSWGGQVKIVPIVEGVSTANLIRRGQLDPG